MLKTTFNTVTSVIQAKERDTRKKYTITSITIECFKYK